MFVGRLSEIKVFLKIVEQPEGQAVLVIGHSGFGKTSLLNKLSDVSETIPDLQCNSIRYEITPTDHVDSVMALVMDELINAAEVSESSLAGTPKRIQQWKAFLNIVPNLGNLVDSLRYRPEVNIRCQFTERLQLVSGLMGDNQRLIVFFDPEKYLQPSSDQSWSLLIRNLPPKIKFVFAQRPEDVLASSKQFRANKNVVNIPEDNLDGFDDEAMDLLLNTYAGELSYSYKQLSDAVEPYNRHPYATVAALDLIKDGVRIDQLPEDPTPEKIVEEQWRRVCSKGSEAISLFEAYAALEVPIPNNLIEHSAGLTHQVQLSLMADTFISSLIRSEETGARIYHAILADFILNGINVDQKQNALDRTYEKVFTDTNVGFFDKIRFMELLQEQNTFSDGIITEFISSLNQQPALKRHFAHNGYNVHLVRKLYEKNFFDELPNPIKTDSGISYPGWLEGVILKNLSEQIPDIISDITKIASTDNIHVYSMLLEAVSKLNIQIIRDLWPTMISWLETCRWHYCSDGYKDIALKLVDGGFLNEVFEFLSIILKPEPSPHSKTDNIYLQHHEAIGKFDFHDLEREVKPVIEYLEQKVPLSTIDILESLLSISIELEYSAADSEYPKTSHWRRAIEEHEQNIRSSYHKDFLLLMLRNALEKAIASKPVEVKQVIEKYLDQDSLLFKRMALHIIRKAKSQYLDIAINELTKPGSLDELHLHHEMFLMLRDVYPLLEEDQKVAILSIIKVGPDEEKTQKTARWAKKNYSDSIDIKEYCERYKNYWIRDRLQMIKDSLIDSEAEYYSELVEKYNESDHPEFTSYIGRGGCVSHESPISAEGWNSLSAKECVDYIISWKPSPTESGDYLKRICPSGLASLMKVNLKKRWVEFVPELQRLIENTKHPVYAYELLDFVIKGLQDTNDDSQEEKSLKTKFDYSQLLDIIEKAVHKWAYSDPVGDAFETGYPLSVCNTGIRLLEQLIITIDKDKKSVSEDLLQSIKQILLELCSHPDPVPEHDDPQEKNYSGYHDPMTVSINHIRPMALRELLRYAFMRSNILNLKGERWEGDVKSKVNEMLDSDAAYSVRSVLGENWAWLFHLDEKWAREYHEKIFPKEDTTNRYFITAWDSYITHKYGIDDAGYDLMRPLYIIAIDNAILENNTHSSLEPLNSLADHLAGFYRFEIEDLLSGTNVTLENPLVYIYSLTPNKIHSRMIWALWRTCQDLDETDKCEEVWEKARILWQFRLENVEEKDWNKCFARELSWFIHFLTISQLNIMPDEVRDLLVKTIQPSGNCDREHGLRELIEYLASVSNSHIADSVALLAQVFDTHGANWYFKDESVKDILENATQATQKIKNTASSIVHKLGECGKDWARPYLGRLRQ